MRMFHNIVINTMLKRFAFWGKDIKISPLAFFDNKCEFERHVLVKRFCMLHNVSMGSYSYMGAHCNLFNCKLGRFVSIAGNVSIGQTSHPLGYVSTNPMFYGMPFTASNAFCSKRIKKERKMNTVGHDAYLGQGVIIRDSLNIGVGAVVGAGAVVTHDVPPYAVVAGVPAKVIKYRFDETTREALLQSEWWNWPEEKLGELGDLFQDVSKFLEYLKNGRGEK